METKWFVVRPCGPSVIASCSRENVCLIHGDDSLAWSAELVDMFCESEGIHLIVDLARMDYISLLALYALANLESLLKERSGTLKIRGVRPHVLAAFMAVEPLLDASGFPVDAAGPFLHLASAA